MKSDRTEEERSRQHESEAGDERPAEEGVASGEDSRSASAERQAGSGEQPPGGGAEVPRSGGGGSEADELRDKYLRLAAEFDNYRKRTERERTESSTRAQGKLVQSMLDAIDDLERVADFTEETTTVTALLEGVQMVERKLLRALESAGLERLDAHGAPFDPEHHEALMTATTEVPHEDDTVGEVFQKGYRFQGHLLRPARVQVRKHSG